MNLAARVALPLFLLTVGVDQASKIVMRGWLSQLQPPRVEVLPVLDWRLLYNPGMSFSLLEDFGGGRWLLTGLALIVALVLLLSVRERGRGGWYGLGVGLIAGGAIGNAIDRLYLGAVVDFIDLHWGSFSPFVFNLADAAITIGVCCLLFDMFFGQKPRQ